LKKNTILIDVDQRGTQINNKKPYIYRSTNPLTLLKQLYDIMTVKMKPVFELRKDEIETIKIVNEVLGIE